MRATRTQGEAMNAHDNGAAVTPVGLEPGGAALNNVMRVNVQEVAQFALMFLARADMKAAERHAYAQVEVVLQGLATGRLRIVEAPQEGAG